MKEVIVIGAGIVGSFIAHELSKYDVHVRIIEKHSDICEEVSSANSAIVHAGYDPEIGCLKGKLNILGAKAYPALCKSLHVDYQQVGALVVACGEEEERALEELYRRAKQRDIDVSYVGYEEIRNREPNISKHVTKAMDVPSTAIITPWELCYALMDECLLNGCDLHLEEEVLCIDREDNRFLVQTTKKQYIGDVVINAAGLGAAKIMEMIEDETLFQITPKRGQYFILSKQAKGFVNEVLYPVPTSVGKGVLVVPTIHGNTLLGPNAEVLSEADSSTTMDGLQEIRDKLNKSVQNIPYQEVIHSYSGVRPCGNHNDFYLKNSKKYPTFIHCACIDSPGLASAPAIGKYVLYELVMPVLEMRRKIHYIKRDAIVRMSDKSLEEKQRLIKEEPKLGHIICRCEEISEQEVVDCIHRPCGARSVKGVKKRVRPGMGKCQGGFCEIEVAKILARELKIPLDKVVYDADSFYESSKGEQK
ncbi:MAG: NAD(P)/FAD-dependent oxidoreductase [Longicatena sp.]